MSNQSTQSASNQRLHSPDPASNQRLHSLDPDLQLTLRRLTDLYQQRQRWQSGQAMALHLAPFRGVNPRIGLVEHWIGTSQDPVAHLLSVPLNALIDHYEQVLWLAKIPLPTL